MNSAPEHSRSRVVDLRDGTGARLRPIRPGDAAKLVEGLQRLSDDSRVRRFFYNKTSFGAEELQRLATPDGKNHFAIVLAILDEGGAEAEVVAVARCFRDEHETSTGEVAFTTVDDWQGVGIGTALATDLARWCCDAGITSWKAAFLMGNKGIRKVLGAVGVCGLEQDLGSGVVEVTCRLFHPGSQPPS